MKAFYVLLLALAISAVSCRTKDGEAGPAGASNLNKQGSISGTITYTDDNGNVATTPFNYQYFETLEDNKFYYEKNGTDLYYELSFQRRDLKDNNNYFDVSWAYGYGTNGVEDDPSSVSSVDLSLLKVINNSIYSFEADEDYSYEITNLSLDPSTGRLIFDFESNAVYYGSRAYATVSGRVDVILNRVPSSFSPR